jgi:hypothetical protein
MMNALQARSSSEDSMRAWSQARVGAANLLREEGVEVTSETAPDAECAEDPDPDGFAGPGCRLPKGYKVATAHAEAVLLDRTRALLDRHYDQVFLEEWLQRQERSIADPEATPKQPPTRPRRYHVDRRVLEAQVSHRYEIFSLPQILRTAFRRYSDEQDWTKLEVLCASVIDAADGVIEVPLRSSEDLATLQKAALSSGGALQRWLSQEHIVADVYLAAGTRILDDLSQAIVPCSVRAQLVGWSSIPLSEFAEALRRQLRCSKPESLKTFASHWACAGEEALRLCVKQGGLTFISEMAAWWSIVVSQMTHSYQIAFSASLQIVVSSGQPCGEQS